MKKILLKFINKIKKHKIIIIFLLTVFIVLFGFIGEYKILHSISLSFIEALAMLGLNPPSKINFWNFTAYILALILVFGTVLILILNKLIENNLYKALLYDDNIMLFGFGEVNKSFLENFKSNKKKENIIVIDEEDKNFNDFEDEGYLFLKRDIDDKFLDSLDFEKTSNIIVAFGNDRENIDIALKLLDRLKKVKTETKLIVHVNDDEIRDLFFEKLEEIKKDLNVISDFLVNLKTFSLNKEIADNLFDKEYVTKLVPYDYAKLNTEKNELKVAVIGNSDVNLEIIKRIFINFIFPNELKVKIFLIDKNENEFLEKVKFHTNYTSEKFPHIILESKKLNFDLLKDKNFWSQEDLIDIIIAFDDENKNLETTIDLFEKVFIYKDKEKLNYPNVFFLIKDVLAFSNYIDANKNNFKNFFTFGNIKKILSVKNLLDDEKFTGAMKIHYTWTKKDKSIKEAWYLASPSKRESSMAQYENISFKLLSLGFEKVKNSKNDDTEEYKKLIENIEKKNLSFEEFLNSGDYYKLCNTEHRRWNSYHFINNWEYEKYEAKEKEHKTSLKLHNCLTDFKNFEFDSIKNTFIYDFKAYQNIPKYLDGIYKIVKIKGKE